MPDKSVFIDVGVEKILKKQNNCCEYKMLLFKFHMLIWKYSNRLWLDIKENVALATIHMYYLSFKAANCFLRQRIDFRI